MGLYTLSIKTVTAFIHFRIKLDKDGSVKLGEELEFQSLDEFETFFSKPHSIRCPGLNFNRKEGMYVHLIKPVSREHRY